MSESPPQAVPAQWQVVSRSVLQPAQLGAAMGQLGCRVQESVAQRLYGVVTCAQPVELAADLELNQVSLGAFSYISQGSTVWHARIGNYVSIARDALIGMAGHPTDWLSPSPVGYMNFFKEYSPDFKPQANFAFFPKLTEIEHSAWIGARVMVPGNKAIKIGRGAVVAAGSVVTKDVPPYAIVAGNPARLVRMRFDEALIEALERSQWWNYDVAQLQRMGIPLDFSDPTACLEQLQGLSLLQRTQAVLPESRIQLCRVQQGVLLQVIKPQPDAEQPAVAGAQG